MGTGRIELWKTLFQRTNPSWSIINSREEFYNTKSLYNKKKKQNKTKEKIVKERKEKERKESKRKEIGVILYYQLISTPKSSKTKRRNHTQEK